MRPAKLRSDCAEHPRSLIRVFDGRSRGRHGSNVSSRGKLRLWSDCADAQTDFNLSCVHMPTCNLCWVPAQINSNIVHIGPVKQTFERKIAIIFLSISLNMCFGCSKEPSHRDGSFEYPQHMFWLRSKEKNLVTHSYLGAWSSTWDYGDNLICL